MNKQLLAPERTGGTLYTRGWRVALTVGMLSLAWASALPPALASGVGISTPADQPVSGKITDEKGDAIPGVSVVLKGTTRGTSTDVNGQFKLNVPDRGAVLIVSFVGYVPRKLT